ncbi:uncharacterized protein TrAFT101_001442 [Trichoderma asperellum]|uniref:uncharacterized protein n=1 Tax=Trichoderma asperellum TaxID=101201 RepID=UPI00332B734B|nr:hypothetical protein TrAFT101_001442 [Trichoderma asperellum]
MAARSFPAPKFCSIASRSKPPPHGQNPGSSPISPGPSRNTHRREMEQKEEIDRQRRAGDDTNACTQRLALADTPSSSNSRHVYAKAQGPFLAHEVALHPLVAVLATVSRNQDAFVHVFRSFVNRVTSHIYKRLGILSFKSHPTPLPRSRE